MGVRESLIHSLPLSIVTAVARDKAKSCISFAGRAARGGGDARSLSVCVLCIVVVSEAATANLRQKNRPGQLT